MSNPFGQPSSSGGGGTHSFSGQNRFGQQIQGSSNVSQSLFGNTANTQTTASLFGGISSSSTSGSRFGGFGSTQSTGTSFGVVSNSSFGGGFNSATPPESGFSSTTSQVSGSAFGAPQSARSAFGATTVPTSGSAFGANSTPTPTSGFAATTMPLTGSAFHTTSTPTSGNSFGATTMQPSGSAFSMNTTTAGTGFVAATMPPAGSEFGATSTPTVGSGFGMTTLPTPGISLGVTSAQAVGSDFSNFASTQKNGSVFQGVSSFGSGKPAFGSTQNSSIISEPGAFGSSTFGSTQMVKEASGLFGTGTAALSGSQTFGTSTFIGTPSTGASAFSWSQNQETSSFMGMPTAAPNFAAIQKQGISSTAGKEKQTASAFDSSAEGPSLSAFNETRQMRTSGFGGTTASGSMLFGGTQTGGSSVTGHIAAPIFGGSQGSAFDKTNKSTGAETGMEKMRHSDGGITRTSNTANLQLLTESSAFNPTDNTLQGNGSFVFATTMAATSDTSTSNQVKVKTEKNRFEFNRLGQSKRKSMEKTSKVFGKPAGMKVEQDSTTGRPSTSKGLFGKTGKKDINPDEPGHKSRKKNSSERDGDGRKLFGKSERHGDDSRHSKSRRRSDDSKPTRKLFGKAISQAVDGDKGRDSSSRNKTIGQKKEDGTVDQTSGSIEKHERFTRQSSMTDMSNRVSIVCKDVPVKYNQHMLLRKHFSKFGEVAKVFPNPRKRSATIHFVDHEAASNAKCHGSVLGPGIARMTIFWGYYTTGSNLNTSRSLEEQSQKRKNRDDEMSSTGKVSKSRSSAWPGSALDDELKSMSGTEDIVNENLKTLTRPKEIGRSRERATRSASPLSSSSSTSLRSPEKKPRGNSPVTVSSSSSVKSDKVSSSSSLTNAVAHNVTERLEILDNRDKIFRQGRKKQSKLSTAKAFIGTCTDMCPEKERYCREDRRRLHVYEMLPGTDNIHGQNPKVDHRRAVKEYSRSSADQEEPMPHELRPSGVLQMTMNYLLTEIADKGQDGKWGDWFDFLWNRTRGIRKDITQQQLCDRTSVELLEKCARFHIFCSERLCEEDYNCFDDKINNENLTKCLQTLKEFYYDLETRHHAFCENEAEFRAYMVLMNLNEGDILREVQQLRPDVRNSNHITFAVAVYSSLNSNNYVRFFRLIREASFLNACILHRYFTQVRTRALASLVKAYGVGTKGSQYPLDELVRVLSFETRNESRLFCCHFGLSASEDEVKLLRGALIEPEEKWPPRRAVDLVESKRMVSVGEAINGCNLPPLFIPEPVCSFDQQGRFVGSSEASLKGIELHPQRDISTMHQQTTDVPDTYLVPDTVPIVAQTQPPAKSKFQYPNDTIKEIAKELFWVVIDEFCRGIGQEVGSEVQMMLNCSDYFTVDILNHNLDDLARDIVSEVLVEETLRKRRVAEEERKVLLDRLAVSLMDEVLQSSVNQNCQNLAASEMRDIENQLRKKQIEKCTGDVAEQTMDKAVQFMIKTLAEDFTQECKEKIEEYERIEKSIQLSRAGKYFQLWRKEHKTMCKLKRSMLEFPCSTSMRKTSEQVKMLIPDRTVEKIVKDGFYVSDIAKLTIESPLDIGVRLGGMDKLLTAHALYLKLCLEKSWQAQDLTRVLELIGTEESKIYFKLLLSLPNGDDTGESEKTAMVQNWLKAKFTRGQRQSSSSVGEILSLYKIDLPVLKSRCQRKVGVCVRTVNGILSDRDVLLVEKTQQFLGTTGILFLLPSCSSLTNSFWEEEQDRLRRVIKTKPACPACPLVVLVLNSPGQNISENMLRSKMGVQHFIEMGLISNLFIMRLEIQAISTLEGSQLLHDALCWLAKHHPPVPKLQLKFVRDFVEDFLLEEYYTPVLQNLRYRQQHGYLHQDPNKLIHLFNANIQHLAEVASLPSLGNVSWPVTEFVQDPPQLDMPIVYWNKTEQLQYQYDLLTSLVLPEFDFTNRESEAWSQVCQDVWKFSSCVLGQCPSPVKVDFVSRIQKLLKKTQIDFEETCYLMEGNGGYEPTYINMAWTDLIGACIDYRLMSSNFSDPHFKDGMEELKVVYKESKLKKFKTLEEWQHFETSRDLEDATTLNETVHRAKQKLKLQENNVQKCSSIETFYCDESSRSSGLSLLSTSSTVPQTKSSENLSSIFIKEKDESKKFEDYLKHVLQEGELESFSDEKTAASFAVTPQRSLSSIENIDSPSALSVTEETSDLLMSEKLAKLKEMIESDNHDSRKFEKRLCSIVSENIWENFK